MEYWINGVCIRYMERCQCLGIHFEELNTLAYKIENGLIKLIESLEKKKGKGEWVDHMMIKEGNAVYGNE